MAAPRKKNETKKNGKKNNAVNGNKKPVKNNRRSVVFRTRARAKGKPEETPQAAEIQSPSHSPVYVPFVSTHVQTERYEPPRELPEHYGDNQIYIMVRDPNWIFSYWEIQKDHQDRALAQLGGNWNDVRSVLRIYDLTAAENFSSFSDIELRNLARTWYISVQANRSYVVEIGLLHRDGRFVALARSNQVTTPRSGMSEVIDEQWMGIDFDKMYALSGGFEVGKSSAELHRLMQEYLTGSISSGSGGMVSSGASPVRIKKRGFWFVLDCELIVYGATEPDATVTMQGKPVKLRPDGTFTLRYALPDCKLVLDAKAASADGLEDRTIIPIVERKTERPAPVLRPEPNV